MVFNQIPQKSKCKLPLSFSICSKDFMKCLHVELYPGSNKKFTKITQKSSTEYNSIVLK